SSERPQRRVDDLPLHVGRLRFEAACEPCGEREPGAVRAPLGGGLADHEDAICRGRLVSWELPLWCWGNGLVELRVPRQANRAGPVRRPRGLEHARIADVEQAQRHLGNDEDGHPGANPAEDQSEVNESAAEHGLVSASSYHLDRAAAKARRLGCSGQRWRSVQRFQAGSPADGVTSTREAPASTMLPGDASTATTVPAISARSVVSIFMASSTTRAWPAATASPTATSTCRTLPGMGATVSPPPTPAVPRRSASPSSKACARPSTETNNRSPARTTNARHTRPSTASSISAASPPSPSRVARAAIRRAR